MASTTARPPLQQHHFLLRRLHSLTGIVPIGVFLIAHLITNSTIVWGTLNDRIEGDGLERRVGTFQHEVTFINELPLLLLIEISLWASIAFHSILGLWYARTGRTNTRAYGYGGNVRYTLQRISGYVGILFIFYHVATLRWGWAWLVPGRTEWSHEYASSTLAMALRGAESGVTPLGILVSLFYFAGVTLLVFHFANGLWTAAITWGLTISAKAQRNWGYACAALGVVLMGAGWAAVIGFATLDPEAARQVEARLHQQRATDEEPAPSALPARHDAAAASDTRSREEH